MARIDSSGTVLLQQNGADVQYSLDNSANWIDIPSNSWPVTLANTDTTSPLEVIFISVLSLNSTDQYFIIDSSNITIDGSDNVVNVNIDNYPGLIQNGTGSNDANSYITIKNIGVESTNTLAVSGGWICQANFGENATDNYVENCYSTGDINGDAAGGILGENSSGSATNCHSTGDIVNIEAGGIFGRGSDGSANNCYSTGDIIGSYSGGIFANNSPAGASATNCHSTGDISGPGSGGIFGSSSSGSAITCYSTGPIGDGTGGIFGNNSSGSAADCYSTGAIGVGGGGIFGQDSQSGASATNCYSIGPIGESAGGIFATGCSGLATGCYSIGPIGQYAGGIFAPSSQSGSSATNCYSTGPISSSAGGIFGSSSSAGASAINCYSSGDIGGQYAGGIFGDYSQGTATNCYSTGPISSANAGGIFGDSCSGSAINCYSTGTIAPFAGGIFGSESTGTATNCYSTGTGATDINSGIGARDVSYCYYTNGSTNWLDSAADASLNIDGSWKDIDTTSTKVPYLLSSFYTPQTLYNPSSGTDVGTKTPDISGNYTWSITSVNGSTSGNAEIAIDGSNGIITFGSLENGAYEVNVLAADSFGVYSFETFTNYVSSPIETSGSLLVKQDIGSDVQYSLDAGVNWTTAVWPVTLQNADTSSALEVTFISDLSFNSADQYFIIDSSNITIDGSDNTVNVNVSTNNYPGLVRNGTVDTSGNSNITIRNVGVVSSYRVASGGGWIGQAYFGSGATNNLVTNCYSTGDISDDAGGIFGSYSSGSATNCYSIGTIGTGAGGIFGQDSSGSATNCYSRGIIGDQASGIFGQNSSGSATNCYSTGTIINGYGIGLNVDASYCYYTDGASFWLDASADASLNVSEPNAWTDIDLNSDTVPYLLSSFTRTLYSTTSATDASNSGASIVTDCSFSIVSVNGLNPSFYSSGITIDENTGDISFDLLSLQYGVYEVNVLATNTNDGYSFGTFTNSLTTLNASGSVLLRQQPASYVQYSTDSGTNWTDITTWPVALNNTDSGNSTLSVTFISDLSLNSTNQYFIIDSSNIIVNGSNHIVNINISGAGYRGLFRNGTYYYRAISGDSSQITASNNAFSDITIQNIIIDSHSSSLLAIQETQDDFIKFGNGWLCQIYFGLGGSNNNVENCSSNGRTFTRYWVDVYGRLYSNNSNATQGGCILGDGCSADVTNCYSTGNIGDEAGGIFGYNGQGSATNCYSTGTIGVFAGGIFGYVSSGSATNCYSTGDINGGGGIFGPNSGGSATNCYSTGTGATNIDRGIGGNGIITNCYYTNGSAYWLDSAADASLNIASNAWTDINLNSETVPYLLSAFTATLYSASTGTNANSSGASIVTDCSFSIVSVNGFNPSLYTSITIDSNTGDITFNLLSLQYGAYEVNVLATNTNDGYSFGTFTNNVATIDASGTVLLQQNGNDVQYSLDNSANWITALWPVTLNNTDTPNTLTITFISDLSFNSADQYFVMGSSYITIDGSNHIVNIDISGAGYPGLVRNGTYSYDGDGNIINNDDGQSYITIQNITLNSNNSSLLAIAASTNTGSGDDKYGNGWLCQAYFGLGGSNNNVDNCSSNGTTVTSYWINSNGIQNSDSFNSSGGCILGSFCSGNVTNCYSTGTIGGRAGGIFGQGSYGSATNCYSIGPIGGGGIFGIYSASQAQAANCYSTGPISSGAGGIFGQYGSGSATNCYSTGPINGEQNASAGGIFGSSSQSQAQASNCYSTGPIGTYAGGIFGLASEGSASNCYSIGTIGDRAGGIFGSYSYGSASASNCYSTGDIGGQFAGGIFGDAGYGSATNCYSIGTGASDIDRGIGGRDASYCYYTDGSANWSDSAADASLNIASNAWTDIDLNATNVPYLLSSFTSTLYNPDSGINATTSGASVVTDCSFSIVSVNGLTPLDYSGITIDSNTGDISFNLLSLQIGIYEVNVLATNTKDGYSFGTFTNRVPTTIDASGTVDLRQSGSIVQYSNNGGSWTDAIWPVTLINDGTGAPGTRALATLPLTMTFTTDLSLNSAYQYFIIDSSNIIIDGSNHIVDIDISGAGYPGLVQNGSYYYDGSGNITASNDAYSDITIRNITLNSNSSSLLAIARTTSLISDDKYGNGWLCQAYFGLDGSNNTIDNCSSNGGTYTIYWVDAYGVTHSDNLSYTQGGCILGDFCNADVSNCYSTGNIVDYAGGIFGYGSYGSISNSYSTGPIGQSAGGIFGPGSQGTATNCYSIGTNIGVSAGGIFGPYSQGSASNCYSIGTIGDSAGGIFGAYSQGSATYCYSSGDSNSNTRFSGGIFGRYSQGSATNCYFSGTINIFAGGIFGSDSSGSATNCYSTGNIGQYAGGIFGSDSSGSAINCYSTGTLTDYSEGIGSNIDISYCYVTNDVSNWLDSAADASLNPLNAWTDIDRNSTKVPYRLTSFLNQQILYDPSSGSNVVTENPAPDVSGIYTWSITSVNGSTTNNEGISIDSNTGNITFNTLTPGSYDVNVLAVDSFGKYSYETFTNIISNICFPAGTPIVTNQGIIPINKINPKIHTIRNKKIVAITKTVTPDKYLVRFEKDALGTNLPCETTTMTKNHMLFYKGKMMKAKEFLKTHNDSVTKVPYNGQVLYNVLLEEHDKMIVNNLICETLHPDNYVAQMYRAFKTLTPKQRVEAIQKVNKVVLTEGIYKKPSAKR